MVSFVLVCIDCCCFAVAVQVVGNHSIDSDTTSLLLSALGSVLRRRLADEVHSLTGNSRRLQAGWGDLNSLLDAVNDIAASFGMSSVNGESQNVNEPNVDGVFIQTQVSALLLLFGVECFVLRFRQRV